MNANEIMDKKFDKSFNGYKMEEVDEFLRSVSIEFSGLQTQNETLEKKLEVLADKIREYRNDEDAIKEALLGAQKQSASVTAAAKEAAEKTNSEAREKADKMIADAEANVAEKKAFAEKLVTDANAEKERIIAECKRKEEEMAAQLDNEIKKREAIIARTREESNAYLKRLLTAYKEHIEMVNSIPELCENEFILNAKYEPPEKAEPVVEVVEPVAAQAVEQPADEPAAEEAKLEQPSNTQEIPFQPVFEEETASDEVEEFVEPEGDSDSPFYDKSKRKKKYEKLEFGNNK